MKRKVKIVIMIIGILLCLPKKVEATPANSAFKDDNFYQCIIESLGIGNGATIDTNLTDEQLASIESLNCNDREIQDVSGLEKLTNVTGISLSNNNISSIDLTHNPKLKEVRLHDNQLTSIDVTHNLELEGLDLERNQIEEIDITKNINLTGISIRDNKVKQIDLSKNTKLKSLTLDGNRNLQFDLSHNLELQDLDVSNIFMTELDISHNPNLETFSCVNSFVTTIDFTHNPKLRWVDMRGGLLTKIDLSHNPELVYLQIGNQELKELDVSHNPNLYSLGIDRNKFTYIDLSKNPNLKSLTINHNHFLSLDMKSLNNLETFHFLEQTRTLEVYHKGGKLVLPLRYYDENLDPSKVELISQKGISYDSKTGLITFDAFVDQVQYTYHSSEKYSFPVVLTLKDNGKEYLEEMEPPKLDDTKTDIVEVPDTKMNQDVILILIAIFILLIGTGIFYIQLGRQKGRSKKQG